VDIGRSVTDTKDSDFGGGTPGVVRAFGDMKDITSDKLTDFAGLGLILYMEFTLDNVYSSWARVVSRDGLAGMDLTESRHQVVRFVGRSVFIEPVDLQVIVIVMRAALETSLRTFDVSVRHIEDVRDSWSSLVPLYDYDFWPFYPLARITRHEVQWPSPIMLNVDHVLEIQVVFLRSPQPHRIRMPCSWRVFFRPFGLLKKAPTGWQLERCPIPVWRKANDFGLAQFERRASLLNLRYDGF